MWGRSGYSPFSHQRDYKQQLRNLDKDNIINFREVDMQGRDVDNYLNSLLVDKFLYILNNGNQFDRNKIISY